MAEDKDYMCPSDGTDGDLKDFFDEMFKRGCDLDHMESLKQKFKDDLEAAYNYKLQQLEWAYEEAAQEDKKRCEKKVAEMARASREGEFRARGREHLLNAIVNYAEALSGEPMKEEEVQDMMKKLEQTEAASWDSMKQLYAAVAGGDVVSVQDMLTGVLGLRASTSPAHKVQFKIDFKSPESVEEALDQLKQIRELFKDKNEE